MDHSEKHIVVIGGGFAGVETAIKLRKKKHKVTLISNREYFFIYPISIWIPIQKLPFEKATLNLKSLAKKHGFEFIRDEFTGIDQEQNIVKLKELDNLNYDYLVIASGAWKVPHPGIEHTLSICGHPEQSVAIRDRFNEIAAKGGNIAIGFGGNPKDKSAVRGGPAFELMFNMIHELKKRKADKHVTFTF
ncbi:MAG TPA: FAD-dependent oxidoreductase, partial [Bacteroidales bacterium]|nr:FAD-dependent oxidoreductase [Bacteroidales bacterium]